MLPCLIFNQTNSIHNGRRETSPRATICLSSFLFSVFLLCIYLLLRCGFVSYDMDLPVVLCVVIGVGPGEDAGGEVSH